MGPRLIELIKDIQILERDIRQCYQRFGITLSDSLHNVQKTIEKDTMPARCQYQMIGLAAMVIEKAEHAKVSLLPRAGPFDSGNNQNLLLDYLSQHCSQDALSKSATEYRISSRGS
jgi:hypothetical protein